MAIPILSEHVEYLRQFMPNIDELLAEGDRRKFQKALRRAIIWHTPWDGSTPPEEVYKMESINNYFNEHFDDE